MERPEDLKKSIIKISDRSITLGRLREFYASNQLNSKKFMLGFDTPFGNETMLQARMLFIWNDRLIITCAPTVRVERFGHPFVSFRYQVVSKNIFQPSVAAVMGLTEFPDDLPVFIGVREDYSDFGAHTLFPVTEIGVAGWKKAPESMAGSSWLSLWSQIENLGEVAGEAVYEAAADFHALHAKDSNIAAVGVGKNRIGRQSIIVYLNSNAPMPSTWKGFVIVVKVVKAKESIHDNKK